MVFKSGMVLCFALTGAFSSADLTYDVTDLGTLGGSSSQALGINASGQVVGVADRADGLHGAAFLYSGGVMTDLETIPGGNWSQANGINASGEVVGIAGQAAGPLYAFLFSGGVMTSLGALYGDYSCAFCINAAGQVAGYSTVAPGFADPFLFSGGVMTDLGLVGADDVSGMATGINSSGQVVGSCWGKTPGTFEPFLYSGGTMTALGVLGGTYPYAGAYGINDSGQIVGTAYSTDGGLSHAILYSEGGIQDLGTLGGSRSAGRAINDSGVVVGVSNLAGDTVAHGFVYCNGIAADLNDMLDAAGSGYTIKDTAAIADNGMIAANGSNPSGQTRALLLSPNAGVAGTVFLQDFAGDVTKVPVAIEIRAPGTTTVVQEQTVCLDADGSYRFSTVLTGTYDVAVKASHWLRQRISTVTLPGDAFANSVDFSLINGDVNGDNTINLGDLMAVAAAWRSTPGSSHWNPNADLNGDGTVNMQDWMIVAQSWRRSGAR